MSVADGLKTYTHDELPIMCQGAEEHDLGEQLFYYYSFATSKWEPCRLYISESYTERAIYRLGEDVHTKDALYVITSLESYRVVDAVHRYEDSD